MNFTTLSVILSFLFFGGALASTLKESIKAAFGPLAKANFIAEATIKDFEDALEDMPQASDLLEVFSGLESKLKDENNKQMMRRINDYVNKNKEKFDLLKEQAQNLTAGGKEPSDESIEALTNASSKLFDEVGCLILQNPNVATMMASLIMSVEEKDLTEEIFEFFKTWRDKFPKSFAISPFNGRVGTDLESTKALLSKVTVNEVLKMDNIDESQMLVFVMQKIQNGNTDFVKEFLENDPEALKEFYALGNDVVSTGEKSPEEIRKISKVVLKSANGAEIMKGKPEKKLDAALEKLRSINSKSEKVILESLKKDEVHPELQAAVKDRKVADPEPDDKGDGNVLRGCLFTLSACICLLAF